MEVWCRYVWERTFIRTRPDVRVFRRNFVAVRSLQTRKKRRGPGRRIQKKKKKRKRRVSSHGGNGAEFFSLRKRIRGRPLDRSIYKYWNFRGRTVSEIARIRLTIDTVYLRREIDGGSNAAVGSVRIAHCSFLCVEIELFRIATSKRAPFPTAKRTVSNVTAKRSVSRVLNRISLFGKRNKTYEFHKFYETHDSRSV